MRIKSLLGYTLLTVFLFFTLQFLTFSCFPGISSYHREEHCCHLGTRRCSPYNFLQETYIHLGDYYLNLTDPLLEQDHIFGPTLPGAIAFHRRNTKNDFMITHHGVFYAQ